MIAQHEQQHDETMLATHQLRSGPAGARPRPTAGPAAASTGCRPKSWSPAARSRWAPPPSRGRWTTNGPRTGATCRPFCIDTTPVTNGAYQAFIEDGGYDDARWWAPDGLGPRSGSTASRAPLFWRRDGGQWLRRRFGRDRAGAAGRAGAARELVRGRRLRPLGRAAAAHRGRVGEGRPARPGDRAAPAATRGATRTRRPSTPTSASAICGPAPAGSYPAGASPLGVRQLIGDVWEWTSSDFLPLPGLRGLPLPGVLGGVLRRRATRCCAAVRSPSTRWPAGARSATGTTRSGGRSSPGSAPPGTRGPGGRA